ncbi:hypothetical protein GGI21_002793, partial [Coemansia aciculifera]
MLSQIDNTTDDTTIENKEPDSISSDTEEDIDSETAMNTVYNLLNELGDLNRSNRRTAEALAEQFSVLQAQVVTTTPAAAAAAAPPTTATHPQVLSEPGEEDDDDGAIFHTPP